MKFSLCILLIFTATHSFAKKEVETVSHVDLERYLGTWYEIASIPQRFQKDCASSVEANYSLAESGEVKVVNSCKKKDGEIKKAEARAKVVSKDDSNSKLKVTFVKFIGWLYMLGGNYWIIDLADDYSYAVVGDPSAEYAWILSRTHEISQDDLEKAMNSLVKNGYDTCDLITTIQDGGFSERKPLCEVVK